MVAQTAVLQCEQILQLGSCGVSWKPYVADDACLVQDLLGLTRPQRPDCDVVLGWINSQAKDDSDEIKAADITKAFLQGLLMDIAAATESSIEPLHTKADLFKQCRYSWPI